MQRHLKKVSWEGISGTCESPKMQMWVTWGWVSDSNFYGFVLHWWAWMWLQEIVQFQQGESLRHWELGLGLFLSITRLDMKNPAVVCSDCKATERMLTSQIHHHPVFFFFCAPWWGWQLVSGGRGCVGGLLSSPSSSCIGPCRDVHKMFGQTEGKLGNF